MSGKKRKAPHFEGLRSHLMESKTSRARIRLLSGSPFGWNRRGGCSALTVPSAWTVTTPPSANGWSCRSRHRQMRIPVSCGRFWTAHRANNKRKRASQYRRLLPLAASLSLTITLRAKRASCVLYHVLEALRIILRFQVLLRPNKSLLP